MGPWIVFILSLIVNSPAQAEAKKTAAVDACGLTRDENLEIAENELQGKLFVESAAANAAMRILLKQAFDSNYSSARGILVQFRRDTFGGVDDPDMIEVGDGLVEGIGPHPALWPNAKYKTPVPKDPYAYRRKFREDFEGALRHTREEDPAKEYFDKQESKNTTTVVRVVLPRVNVDCNKAFPKGTELVPAAYSGYLRKCAIEQSPMIQVCVVRKAIDVSRDDRIYHFKNVSMCESGPVLLGPTGKPESLGVKDSNLGEPLECVPEVRVGETAKGSSPKKTRFSYETARKQIEAVKKLNKKKGAK